MVGIPQVKLEHLVNGSWLDVTSRLLWSESGASLQIQRGVADDDVRFELFTTGRPERPQGDAGRPIEADPSGDNVTIEFNLDGTTGRVESPKSAHETILNAALRVRSDVPFACAGGVCGTCRAKVTEGEFTMEENYALEKDEVDNGYILTCQTRPTGDAITVDFDA